MGHYLTTKALAGSQQRFRLAIVGTGLVTRENHLPTALSLPDIELCALVDSVVSRASDLARDYGIRPLILADAREVVGKVDGVIVATPNDTHRAIAVPLLEAGISTLVEKPLATTVEDGEAIVEAAVRGGAKVALGYHQRFFDATRLLKRLIDERYFGHVRRFFHQFGTSGGWPALSAYTLRRESIGGGVLVVTGTHFLDRMLHLWGTPNQVELRDDSRGGPEAHCEGHIWYSSGPFAPLEGLVRYSKCVSLPAGLVLDTERGMVVLRDGPEDQLMLFPREYPELELQVSGRETSNRGLDPAQRMLMNFVNACRSGRSPEVDGAQGLESLRLLKRFYTKRRAMEEDWTGEVSVA